jgi:hypothetical protein
LHFTVVQNPPPTWTLLLGFLLISHAYGQQEEASKLLQNPAFRLSNPQTRDRIVATMQAASSERRTAGRARAATLGLPIEWIGKDGRRRALVDFDGDRPRYFITHNANAAISTGANRLQASPASLNGSGFTIGIWDGGSVLSTHQEFNGRVTLKNSAAAADDHATHVAGTLGAFGVRAAAKGMSPSAKIDSYDWDDDVSEMTSRAATYPGEPGKIYISNQSYGFVSGWDYVGESSHMWEWYGSGTGVNAFDPDFGRYDTNARADDAMAYAAPYFLMFRSAGNDREDNPEAGDLVALSFSSTSYIPYNPATQPGGDGTYHNGFENISSDALAKNIVTVGSVGDAVTAGVRDISKAYMSEYSSWGPTDDGRIKPDLVANGEELTSSVATSNTSYDVYSGTSMASPNAAGSAMLLVQLYDRLHPGQIMRASTLKGLLIQTADDLGNPGPDYKYGWGLVNVKAAADLLQDQSTHPGKRRVEENQLNATIPSRTETFTWDGVSPIRATLCWTDPAGTATTAADSRTPRLVNDLDLHLVGPDGTTYLPFVMPFAGTWTVASMDAPATTGVNNTDNAEQVLIAAPANPGDYQVVVNYKGTLTNGLQNYSLILSGSTSTSLPAPVLAASSPSSLTGGTSANTLTFTGSGFQTGATVTLTKAGGNPISAGGLQFTGETITARIDASAVATGIYDVTITNPDGQSSTLPAAVSAAGSLWAETAENGLGSWTTTSTSGSALWTVSVNNPHGGTHSFRCVGPVSANTYTLTSPAIPVPGNASDLSFSFWHSYSFTNGDGGVLEISSDNGVTWTDVAKSTSGATVVQNSYNGTIPTGTGNPLAGRAAWQGSSSAYLQTVLSLDTAAFAGKNLRLRWRLASDSSVSSPGWNVDDLSFNATLNTVTFAQWQAGKFTDLTDASAAEDADPDHDGLTNFAEYALGTDPNAFTAPVSYVKNTDGTLSLTFTLPINTTGLTYHAEVSSDLVNWTEVPLTSLGQSSSSSLLQNMKASTITGMVPAFIRLRIDH